MFKLEERKAARKHRNAVNAGKVDDPVMTHGRDADGNIVVGKDKVAENTAPAGHRKAAENTATDYSKLRSHDDLNKALGEREKPDGWDDMKVDDKQKWLTENAPTDTASSGW